MKHGNKKEQLALFLANKLLQDLVDPQKNPNVPAELRNQAETVARHFPSAQKIDLLYQSLRKDA